MDKLRILLIQGGISGEHEVSINSGRQILEQMDTDKYELSVCTIQKDGLWKFGNMDKAYSLGEALVKIDGNFDLAFIALHGAFGEDGQIQSIFDTTKLPYTGSGRESSVLAINKEISSNLFANHGLTIPRFKLVNQTNDLAKELGFDWPLIIKPCHGGSSVDTLRANSLPEARGTIDRVLASGDGVIIQELIVGREFTCGILDDDNGKPVALPPTEIIPKHGVFFDYESKYVAGASEEITPPNLPEEQIKEIQALALRAHLILGCSGMSRSDFILRDGIFYILETNTIPGMTATSLLPQAAKVAGISFSQMLDLIINSALRSAKWPRPLSWPASWPWCHTLVNRLGNSRSACRFCILSHCLTKLTARFSGSS